MKQQKHTPRSPRGAKQGRSREGAPRSTGAVPKARATKTKLADDLYDDDVISGDSLGADAAGDSDAEMHGDASESAVYVRLNKYLADHGVASRRRCDELIAAGKVTVDGEPVQELGTKIDATRQKVEIDGFVLKPMLARRRYYLLNKPAGVVCTNEARETRPRAVDLVTDRDKGRIYTIGRLDEESKGLILLTNDGEFANRIMHPRFGVEKTYVVKVHGKIEDDALQRIREGVHLSEGRTAGARILVMKRGVDSSVLSLTLNEGMNREIRRVFARFGFKVLDLRRTRIGTINDRGLKAGRWRELTRGEIEDLRAGNNGAASEERVARRGSSRRSAPKPKRGWEAKRPSGDRRSTARASVGDRRSTARASAGDRKSTARASVGDRRSTARASAGDRRSFAKASAGDRRSFAKASAGDRRPSARASGRDRRPFAKASGDDRRPFAKTSGEDQPFTKPSSGDRPSFTRTSAAKKSGVPSILRSGAHKSGFAKQKPSSRRNDR